MTARTLVLLAALSGCAQTPDLNLGFDVSPDGNVSPSVSVAAGGVGLDAGAGRVSAGVHAGVVGVTVTY